jgi:hypothetical protein
MDLSLMLWLVLCFFLERGNSKFFRQLTHFGEPLSIAAVKNTQALPDFFAKNILKIMHMRLFKGNIALIDQRKVNEEAWIFVI